MKLGVLFSGGKDSCLALHKVLEEGRDVKYLLNINPRNIDSFMFHKQDKGLLDAQVERLGIEMVSVESEGVENEELDDLSRLIEKVKDDVDGIVVGGIASSYQGKRVKKICDDFGLEFVAPLWDYEPEKLWDELIGEALGGHDSGEPGFEVIMIKIACDGIGKEWLGRVIDEKALGELRKLSEKFKFRLDFEGGEAETTVLNMPGYSSRIDIDFDVESEGEFRHLMKDVVVK
ncbi:diphthine--ammonia ligase [archaeon]|jgi:diphthine-ammonia ligase|nr:diphthine--ammonia ligase [archaeon]